MKYTWILMKYPYLKPDFGSASELNRLPIKLTVLSKTTHLHCAYKKNVVKTTSSVENISLNLEMTEQTKMQDTYEEREMRILIVLLSDRQSSGYNEQ